MTSPKPGLVPAAVRIQLLNELDVLFGQSARTICRLDTESGAIDECTPAAELVRRIAVVVTAKKVIEMMETLLLVEAAAHPQVTQAALVPALGLTQQGVSHRLSKLTPKPDKEEEKTVTTTSYGTWQNVISLSLSPAQYVLEALGDYAAEYDVEGFEHEFREKVDAFLPEGIQLVGSEFTGPYYDRPEFDREQLAEAIGAIDLLEMASRHEKTAPPVEYVKMKCPTCWGETYRKSTDDEQGFWDRHYESSPSCRP